MVRFSQHTVGGSVETKKVATRFIAAGSYTCTRVVANLDKDFSPDFNIRAVIYSHDSVNNCPASQTGIASDWRSASSMHLTEYAEPFDNLNVQIISGTTYWLVMECDDWGPAGGNDINWSYVTGVITPGMKYYHVDDAEWKDEVNSATGSFKYCLYSPVDILFLSGLVPQDYYYKLEDTGYSIDLKVGKLGDLKTVAKISLKDKYTYNIEKWAEYRIIGSTS